MPISSNQAANRVLWVGSNAVSARRERAIIAAEGFEFVFRLLDGGGQIGGSAEHRLTPETRGFLEGPQIAYPSYHIGRSIRADFGAVVVETDVAVLASYARSFPGAILFRSYGLMAPLPGLLWEHGIREHGSQQLALGRDNVHYLPALEPATEMAWLKSATIELPSLQVIEDDVRAMPWAGQPGLAILALGRVGDPDYDRRLAAFAAEAFGDPVRYERIETTQQAGEPGSLALLDPAQLRRLQQASALLYIDRAAPFLHGFVQQALLMGVPVVYFAGSTLARVMGSGAGQVATVAGAHAVIGRLEAGDPDLASAILAAQRSYTGRLLARQTPERFATAFSRLIATAGPDPADARGPSQEEGNPFAQMERLLAALSQSPTSLAQDPHRAGRVVECLFHLVLQRDPGVEEIDRYMQRVAKDMGPLRALHELLHSVEGKTAWPGNRFRSWLAEEAL